MGSGCFGRVVKAEVDRLMKDDERVRTLVAVKMVRTTSANVIEATKSLVNELKILGHLGSHENVVNLLGACTKNISGGPKIISIVVLITLILIKYIYFHGRC